MLHILEILMNIRSLYDSISYSTLTRELLKRLYGRLHSFDSEKSCNYMISLYITRKEKINARMFKMTSEMRAIEPAKFAVKVASINTTKSQ